MNKTKIDWADMTWNPVTGCLYECEYCYARRIAERFGMAFIPKLGDPGMEGAGKYDSPVGLDSMLELEKPYTIHDRVQPYPAAFMPTFHRYRLNEPAMKKNSQNIFVCSMADLFGAWVPDKWINGVFEACEAAPQHRYLFLTKNAKRYGELNNGMGVPDRSNLWFGTTVVRHGDPIACNLSKDSECHWFLSIEPILEDPFPCDCIRHMDWVIVGSETGNRKRKVIPQKDWIETISEKCERFSIPLFMKESLRGLMGEDFKQEFPW